MEKLDSQSGVHPEVRTFNMLISSAARLGEFDKAEEWFSRVKQPALHPELIGLQPSPESYNTMIQMFTGVGDIIRAEKWFNMIWLDVEVRATLASHIALIRACLEAGEVRRAHRWAEELVKKGCAKNPDYAPIMVKRTRNGPQFQQDWDVGGFVAMILALIEALAKLGNFKTVSRWLRYLVDCGVKPEEAPETWAVVRRVYPREIIPAVLSGESDAAGALPAPPRTKPVVLSGEEDKSAIVQRSLKNTTESSLSEALTCTSRPGTGMSSVQGCDLARRRCCTFS